MTKSNAVTRSADLFTKALEHDSVRRHTEAMVREVHLWERSHRIHCQQRECKRDHGDSGTLKLRTGSRQVDQRTRGYSWTCTADFQDHKKEDRLGERRWHTK